MESLHRLHGSQQSLSQRSVPAPPLRHHGWRNNRTRTLNIHGRLLQLQVDTHASWRPRKNGVPHRKIYLLLQIIPFGLKNTGATYQRLVTQMFKYQLGDTMEVYIDDMLVESKRANDHIQLLSEAFNVLIKYGMKLNPTKYTFRVPTRKFLGYVVTQRGIKASSDQIKALVNI